MNREEREEHVILLYKEGRTFKNIAKEMHMSFRDIGAIINKAKLQAERERGYAAEDIQPKSPESQAFKLFSEGKSTVEVAIALDLPGDRVRAIIVGRIKCNDPRLISNIYCINHRIGPSSFCAPVSDG
jgi:hypothetical protein